MGPGTAIPCDAIVQNSTVVPNIDTLAVMRPAMPWAVAPKGSNTQIQFEQGAVKLNVFVKPMALWPKSNTRSVGVADNEEGDHSRAAPVVSELKLTTRPRL